LPDRFTAANVRYDGKKSNQIEVVCQVTDDAHNKRYVLLIYAALVLFTAGVYLQVRGHEFVCLDDMMYVVENEQVLKGITYESFIWAFTTAHYGNWHPLTWLSHMLDCEFFGLNPMWHHFTSLFFHIANTLLLFGVLKRMTGKVWCSAFVAAAFALHPLRVESVAWVSERKDVLSTFFWLLTMWAYVCYAERPGFAKYIPVVVFFALGLMAKQMLVTLPFVLLLLDYWPLGRLRLDRLGDGWQGMRDVSRATVRLVGEKLPLFILAVVFSAMIYLVQKSGGAFGARMGLQARMANAVSSYSKYIGMMLWPGKLAVFYPYPGGFRIGPLVGSAIFLLSVSVVVILLLRRRPYLSVGWLWYLGTLVPVIGLVQIGGQAMADRYTYVPMIGLLIMIAWAGADFAKGGYYRKIVLGTTGVLVILSWGVFTWFQVGYWRNDFTLFEHALAVTKNNHVAYKCLGLALHRRGKVSEAIERYREAFRIQRRDEEAITNLGAALVWKGQVDEAIRYYREFLKGTPDSYRIHKNLGDALVLREKLRKSGILGMSRTEVYLDEAVEHYRRALELKEEYFEAHCGLAGVLEKQGKLEGAIKHYREALHINPDHSKTRQALEAAMAKQNKSSNLKKAPQ
jgi:hypothetical protein